MKKQFTQFIYISLLLVSLLLPQSATAQHDDPAIDIINSRMVHLIPMGDGLTAVHFTDQIPYIVGRSCYHWMINFEPEDRELEIQETLILPAPAANWDITQETNSQVNPDRSSAVTKRTIALSEGFAADGWCVAKRDPKGEYQYILRSGSKILANLKFMVGSVTR